MEQRFFSIGSLKLAYYELNVNGPKILFLPGMEETALYFKKLVPFLNNKYHAFILEIRGHGDSSHSEEYIMDEILDDIKKFIDSIINDKLIIYGHSYGGMLTLRLTHDMPDKILSAIISEAVYVPSFSNRLQMPNFKDEQDKYRLFNTIYDKQIPSEEKVKEIRNKLDDSFVELFKDLSETKNEIRFSTHMKFEGFYNNVFKNYFPPDVDNYISKSTCPLLFLLSKKINEMNLNIKLPESLIERKIYLDRVKRINDLRPDAKLRVFDLGHNLHIENVEVIGSFLFQYLENGSI